jgi:hypothetical protein
MPAPLIALSELGRVLRVHARIITAVGRGPLRLGIQ